MQTTEKVFLSIPAMGRRLGVSTRTAYSLVEDGAVPVIRLRGVLRVPAGALEEWIVEREAEALASVRRQEHSP
jgi:excisionase family DNA binding protein